MQKDSHKQTSKISQFWQSIHIKEISYFNAVQEREGVEPTLIWTDSLSLVSAASFVWRKLLTRQFDDNEKFSYSSR